MSENLIRHIAAFIGTLVAFLAFFAGYKTGQLGWWWAGFSVIVVYIAIYSLLEA